MPFAPVGGTVCAASPTIARRPLRSSCATKLRNRSTSRWKIGPSVRVVPGTRACSASQISSSVSAFGSASGSHWKYMRCTVGLRWLMSAKPSGELL